MILNHQEIFWSDIASKIRTRQSERQLTCDDSPFSNYRRQEFLKLFQKIDFLGKKVLEVGCGPGGNLIEVLKQQPHELYGADISQGMLSLARENVNSKDVGFVKINGQELPFSGKRFDTVFSAFVLQFIKDESTMQNLLKDMCRVSANSVVLFEKIDSTLSSDGNSMKRPIEYYSNICKSEGFKMARVEFINLQISHNISKVIDLALSGKKRLYAEEATSTVELIQKAALPITSFIDRMFSTSGDFAMIELKRK